jgi:hypothetical protein
MDTNARAERVDAALRKARRTFAAAQLLMSLHRHQEAVSKAYEASVLCGEAAVSIEGYDPRTQWGSWILFGYLFLCHARVSPGLGRMAEVLRGQVPLGGGPDGGWKPTAEASLTHVKCILDYFGSYVRSRARAPRGPRVQLLG